MPAPRRRPPHLGPAIVGGAAGLLVLIAGLTQGLPGLAWSIGLVALVAGVVALARGSLRLLRIKNRAAAAAVLVAGLVVWAGGVGASAAPHDTDLAAASTASASAAAPSGTAAVRTATPTTRPSGSASRRPTAESQPQAGTALALLATLAVKGRAPMTGYARTTDFGPAWIDVDRNGCDTRNDVLRRDLTATTGSGCRVLSGVLHDPYTGRTIDFVRGQGTSTAVQIDHVVSLGDAWQTGAQRLPQARRIDLANDPINLFAVDGPTNEQKGDGDTATWLPPVTSFRCVYVAHQVSVKAAYGLWVTPAEQAAMARILATCPTQRAYTSAVAHLLPPVPPSPGSGGSPPSSTSGSTAGASGGGATTTTSGSGSSSGSSDVYYANCSAARAAGAAPLHTGDAGYRSGLDRDGDGVACE
ncbi:excalibur calcium-binding domain-containing protein [Amnibacterium sp. CER49]|uniref:excalibur calcium-binding domain-containing protein n=1 Tax=Amnibacterium sp. CER49 TaxID=3039161 RepID=UPI00244D1A62|nr:excalibur calcium-binding domain-containing protein [Amnibacterium sp. CER49]MDH2443471.1 excalibur calcium-binding domain-containing protein [Amnibacterium sp. CER49]